MIQIDDNLAADLAEYVDGTLDAAGRARVEARLDADPSLQSLVTKMMIDSERLRAMPRVNAPIDLSELTRTRLERQTLLESTPVAGPRRFGLPSVATAAGLLLAVSLGVLGWSVLSRSQSRMEPPLVLDRDPFAQPSVATAREAEEQARPNQSTEQHTGQSTGQSTAQHTGQSADRPHDGDKIASFGTLTTAGPVRASDDQTSPDLPAVNTSGTSAAAPSLTAAPRPAFEGRTKPEATSPDPVLPEAAYVLIADDVELAAAAICEVFSLQSLGLETLSPEPTRAPEPTRSSEPARSPEPARARESSNTPIDVEPRDSAYQNAQQHGFLPDPPSTTPVQLRARSITREQLDRVLAELTVRGLRATPVTVSRAISPGDLLNITLVDGDAFNLRSSQRVFVNERGHIELPGLAPIELAGLDLEQAQRVIAGRYIADRLTARPQITVEFVIEGSTTQPTTRPAAPFTGPQDWVLTVLPATDDRTPATAAETPLTTRPTDRAADKTR